MLEILVIAALGGFVLYLIHRGRVPDLLQPRPAQTAPATKDGVADPVLLEAHQYLFRAKTGGLILDQRDRDVLRAIRPLVEELLEQQDGQK